MMLMLVSHKIRAVYSNALGKVKSGVPMQDAGLVVTAVAHYPKTAPLSRWQTAHVVCAHWQRHSAWEMAAHLLQFLVLPPVLEES